MKIWFDSLESREKILIVFASILVIITSTYMLILAPMIKERDSLNKSINDWESSIIEISHLKQLDAQSQLTINNQNKPEQSLVVIVDISLRKYNLYQSLQRSLPNGNDNIRVELQEASFNDLILWIEELDSMYNLKVVSANFSSANFSQSSNEEYGFVNTSLTLEY